MRNSDVIIALDFPTAAAVYGFLDRFDGQKPFVKVGMELYYAEGPKMVEQLLRRGHSIFLDLKLHDIPNTVKSAMAVLAKLGVSMVNLHASGTIAMMRAAMEGIEKGAQSVDRPKVLAVTQLTSTDEERMRKELLIDATMEQTVRHYAQNAKAAGLDGVVCSPLEARAVKETCGESFLTVTPGIRFADSDVGDQARVMTPNKARTGGSDYIVVGRIVTGAEDPAAVYARCVREFLANS